jgi:hypothetical protein
VTVEIAADIPGLAAVDALERSRAESENFQTKPISLEESEAGDETTPV